MQYFPRLFDHPKLFWLLKSIESSLVHTQGNGGVGGECTGLGDWRPAFPCLLYHKLSWHCLRDIISLSRPWSPIHKIRGFIFVSLLRLLGPIISNSNSILYLMEERLMWPPKGWLMVAREGTYTSMESIESALCLLWAQTLWSNTF